MQAANPSAWVVHKFGGTSVYDASCFRRVADIVDSQKTPRQAVVLSAAKGVTDVLLSLVDMAERHDPSLPAQLQALRERHRIIAEDLLDAGGAQQWLSRFDADRADLEGVLHTTSLLRSAAQNVRDLVAGYGELWSTTLMAAFLRARVQPNIVAEVDGLALLMDAVRAGYGATVQPGAATARHDRDDLELTQIADAHVGRRNLLVSLSDDELSPAALATRVVVADTARSLVRDGRWTGASLLEN